MWGWTHPGLVSAAATQVSSIVKSIQHCPVEGQGSVGHCRNGPFNARKGITMAHVSLKIATVEGWAPELWAPVQVPVGPHFIPTAHAPALPPACVLMSYRASEMTCVYIGLRVPVFYEHNTSGLRMGALSPRSAGPGSTLARPLARAQFCFTRCLQYSHYPRTFVGRCLRSADPCKHV